MHTTLGASVSVLHSLDIACIAWLIDKTLIDMHCFISIHDKEIRMINNGFNTLEFGTPVICCDGTLIHSRTLSEPSVWVDRTLISHSQLKSQDGWNPGLGPSLWPSPCQVQRVENLVRINQTVWISIRDRQTVLFQQMRVNSTLLQWEQATQGFSKESYAQQLTVGLETEISSRQNSKL